MQKQAMKKLSVSKETLRLLQAPEVKLAAGGTSFTNDLNCRQSMPCSYIDNSAGVTCLC